jgi:hypothetical protein
MTPEYIRQGPSIEWRFELAAAYRKAFQRAYEKVFHDVWHGENSPKTFRQVVGSKHDLDGV